MDTNKISGLPKELLVRRRFCSEQKACPKEKKISIPNSKFAIEPKGKKHETTEHEIFEISCFVSV